MSDPGRRQRDLVEQIAALADDGRTLGVAESLTGGQISAALARGENASSWFHGSVVAYVPEVKFDLLGVTPGPVNTARCAREMAAGAARVLGSELAVAVTGVGGPGSDEGVPEGTVFVACWRRGHEVDLSEHHLDGDPPAVVAQAVELALEALLTALLESR